MTNEESIFNVLPPADGAPHFVLNWTPSDRFRRKLKTNFCRTFPTAIWYESKNYWAAEGKKINFADFWLMQCDRGTSVEGT